MEIFFKYIYVVAISFWVGGISLFSFVQAPALFSKLDRDKAGLCVETMFPGYYNLGYGCAFFAITSLIYIEGVEWTKLSVLAFMLLASLIGGLYILPKIHSVKKELQKEYTDVLKRTFSNLHRLSLVLNFLAWLAGMVILYFIASATI